MKRKREKEKRKKKGVEVFWVLEFRGLTFKNNFSILQYKIMNFIF